MLLGRVEGLDELGAGDAVVAADAGAGELTLANEPAHGGFAEAQELGCFLGGEELGIVH